MKKSKSPLFGWLVVSSAALFYAPLGFRALWDSDEGRYAEIGREMLDLKDWITPHLNYVVYLEKPPLMYWFTAIAFKLFGAHAFAARFGCAAFALGTVIAVYEMGKSWKNERVGLLAGGMLATSLGFFALSQFLVLDMALTFWESVILFCGCALLEERSRGGLRRLTYGMAIAIAGGILTKGPVALILPMIALTIVYLRQKWNWIAEHSPWKPALGLLLFVTLPWYLLESRREPVFPWFFFVHEHLLRFFTTVHHRTEPIYFFIPVILGGFLPWTVFLPQVAKSWFGKEAKTAFRRDPQGAILVLWVILTFVFFSLSQSKLVGYVLPVFPALALLVAYEFDRALQSETLVTEWSFWVSAGVIVLAGLFGAALLVLKLPLQMPWDKNSEWAALFLHGDRLAVVCGLAIFILIGVWGMRRTLACFSGILVSQILLLLTAASVAGTLDPFHSTKALAQRIKKEDLSESRVIGYGVSYENQLQTLPFYLGRRIAVFGDPGELSLGAGLEGNPTTWFVPEEASRAELAAEPTGTWVVTDAEHGHAFEAAHPGVLQSVEQQGTLQLLRKVK